MRSPVVVGLEPDIAEKLRKAAPEGRISWADVADAAADGTVRFGMALSALRLAYVSVTGDFTARRPENGDVQLRARYGSGEPPAHVEIICDESAGRGDFRKERYHRGQFTARCLGKARGWDAQTGELSLDPVAIFR
ncbi:hypothetical protein [Streptomyces sp. HC307]|uniref:hypothetical protein n=1 Tax=Streptomyces flavusporus TaxID=3385496 RepID=UPI00391722B8